MNTTNKSNWPVLKIEDSLRGSINELEKPFEHRKRKSIKDFNCNGSRINSCVNSQERLSVQNNGSVKKIPNQFDQTDLKKSSELYIPNNVRNALDAAGINIDQIINLTSKLENSINEREITAEPIVKKEAAEQFVEPAKIIEHTITDNQETYETDDQTTKNVNSQESEDETTKKKLCSKSEMITISNKGFEVVQNLSARNDFTVSKKIENDPNSSKTSEVDAISTNQVSNIKQRRRSSKIRYATIGNFTLPDSIKNRSEDRFSNPIQSSNGEFSTFSAYKLPFSPSWASDVDSSSYSLNSMGNLSTKIIPARVVPQFKPIVNVHKRACTAPVTLGLNLMNSSSIDSFLSPNEDKDQLQLAFEGSDKILIDKLKRPKHSPIEENSITDEIQKNEEDGVSIDKLTENQRRISQETNSTVDLSKSLPNRTKKKVSVTRSFSYTIGNLTGSQPQQQSAKANSINIKSAKSAGKQDGLKSKSSFSFNISDAFGLNKSNVSSNSKQPVHSKLEVNSALKAENSNSYTNLSSKSCAFSDYNPKSEGKDNRNSSPIKSLKIEPTHNHSSVSSPLFLLTDSISNDDLNVDPGSSLLGFCKSGKEELQNVYDFQHVSTN